MLSDDFFSNFRFAFDGFFAVVDPWENFRGGIGVDSLSGDPVIRRAGGHPQTQNKQNKNQTDGNFFYHILDLRY